MVDWGEHNRQPKKFFQTSEYKFETPTTRPPATLLPLLKHKNLVIPVKMFEILGSILGRISYKAIKFI